MIKSINGFELLSSPKYSQSNYWINVLKIKENCKISKKKLLKKLLSKNIQVRSVWFPNHLQKPYKKNQSYKIEKANKIFQNYICLPSSSFLKESEIKYITNNLK